MFYSREEIETAYRNGKKEIRAKYAKSIKLSFSTQGWSISYDGEHSVVEFEYFVHGGGVMQSQTHRVCLPDQPKPMGVEMMTLEKAKAVVKNPVSVWSPDNPSDGIGDLILCIHESGRYMVASTSGRYAPCPPYIRRKEAERYLKENHYHEVIKWKR